ncbi:acyl-CoA carboxylase subunit epsilon [Streptomyces sp. NPDC001985]|uniref:acyl-CoA carboxylase subunit epsilon n=1 Tax=Streptomyces sp. NPDC001985 TaxID=3154406 RepID=UPI00332BF8CA
MSAAADASLLRVEKGECEPEELAAITAVLLARAAAHPAAASSSLPHPPSTAGWRRLERQRGFQPSHSWQG